MQPVEGLDLDAPKPVRLQIPPQPRAVESRLVGRYAGEEPAKSALRINLWIEHVPLGKAHPPPGTEQLEDLGERALEIEMMQDRRADDAIEGALWTTGLEGRFHKSDLVLGQTFLCARLRATRKTDPRLKVNRLRKLTTTPG